MIASLSLLAAAEDPTREVFGNISPAAQLVFYVLAAAALAVLAFGVRQRVRLWRVGRAGQSPQRLGAAMRTFVLDVVGQRRLRGRPMADLGHLLVFGGFAVLLAGTTLVAVEHGAARVLGRNTTEPVFHHGWYYVVFEFITDAGGLALMIGCVLLAMRRGPQRRAWVTLSGLLAIAATGFAVEGLRMIHEPPAVSGCSFVGHLLTLGLRPVVPQTRVAAWHAVVWWVHAGLVLAWLATLPRTRLLHLIAGPWNLIRWKRPSLGSMALVTVEEVERIGTIGVRTIADFEYRQLVELDACVACGRCEDVCPAHAAGQPLSPQAVVQELCGSLTRAAAVPLPSLHGETIAAATLWSCTACGACVDACPLGVRPLDLITDLRRFLVGDGQLRGAPAAALQKMQRSGNPWGLPPGERMRWAEGLDVPTAADHPQFELLYWVGCAAAYDRRLQQVARSVVRLLRRAGVNFAVLGNEERCTGDAARRMGDELLFQELAAANIATLTRYRVTKIVTHCPHCLNAFRQDYPQLGGHFEVVHHTQLLTELVRAGRLSRTDALSPTEQTVTFHDPCYLARVSGETAAPRELLCGLGGQSLVEMGRHGRQTSCCGAGGGRMWFDDNAIERPGVNRAREALATRTETLAVACPFCLLMLTDSVAAAGGSTTVRDVAELLEQDHPQPSG